MALKRKILFKSFYFADLNLQQALFYTFSMKFTQEQAFESLKRDLTNNGKKSLRMSERTLKQIVEALLPKFADDETGLPDFIESALAILNPVNDNIGKDKSDFIKEWKTEHPEPAPPVKSDEKPTQQNDELAALRAEIEALKQARKEEETNRKLTAKKSSLSAKLKEKGVSDVEWLDNLLAEVNITEELDVDAKAESLLKLYNKSRASVSPISTPGSVSGSGQGEIPEALKRAKELAKKEMEMAQIS